MSLEELREQISQVISDDACSAEFYFLIETDGNVEVKRADLDQSAQEELSTNFVEAVSNAILLNDDLSLIDLSSADDRKDALYLYDLDDVPDQLQHLSNVLERDNFEVFSFNDDSLNNLKGIIILLGHGQQQLVLYKHQYPIALYKRDSGLFIRVRNENRLEKVSEDILRITNTFEFMKIGDNYYICKLKTLERFFGFHQAVMNLAKAGLENVKDSELLDDASVLDSRMDDISFSRKLVKASKDSPVLGNIPNAEVINFVSTHPALKGKIQLSEDGAKLSLKTKASQNLFLKLLNDDFLQSELTKRHYASVAKDPV